MENSNFAISFLKQATLSKGQQRFAPYWIVAA